MPHRHALSFTMKDGTVINAKKWTNPDGTPGGWVAETARVHPTAIVEELAIVHPSTVIEAGARVLADIPIRTVRLPLGPT